jgi:hypothetical protein
MALIVAAPVLAAACGSQPPASPSEPPASIDPSPSSASASFQDQEPGSELAPGTYVLPYASIGGAASFRP